MSRFLSPVCLIVALLMMIAGFGLLAMDGPSASVEMHRAFVDGDESYQEAFEDQLAAHKRARSLTLTVLFVGSITLIFVGFWAMKK